MRGKGFAAGVLMPACGITPAYAGKRLHFWYSKGTRKDHPRLCGEKILLMYEGLAPIGSPPPMRGKEKLQMIISLGMRITPAYAGKSLGSSFPSPYD